jgi:pimeloyl-ACP methyl ester carboxylesterase
MTVNPAPVESLPPTPSPDRSWRGLDMLQGGKGYADAPLGQLHFRDIGPRDARSPLLLIHQSPMSMVEFGAAQNSLAALGVRSVAPDTPGYGLSDQPTCLPTIGGLADNLVALLDHLGIERVVASGHHTGACVATALAARHPDRVAGLVLHGCPVYSAEEAARFREKAEWDHSPKRDGSHLSMLFRLFAKDDDITADQMFAWTWMSLTLFQQGADIGHWAVNRYDMTADLMRVRAPGLIVTETQDIIHYMDERAHAMRPDFALEVLSATGATGIMTDPDRWARLAVDWMRSASLMEAA